MFVKRLLLDHYRNYPHVEISTDRNVNIFVGPNAQGKTNLLESIYVLALTKSHRTHQEKELRIPLSSGWIIGTAGPWTVYVTGETLSRTAVLFMRVSACLACLQFVLFTTPLLEILQVMKKIRIPQIVIELTLIMYRFIFLLADTAHAMRTAQRCRGGQNGFAGGLRDTALLVVHLFGRTMQRYRGLTYGLTSRGFTERIELAPYEAAPVPRRYKAEGATGILMLTAAQIGL